MRATVDREANIFGEIDWVLGVVQTGMETAQQYVSETAAPTDRPVATLVASDLPPPKPLRNTLERLADIAEETVLVQFNDRAPRHLYPKLEDRGYEYETVETNDGVVTVIWRD